MLPGLINPNRNQTGPSPLSQNLINQVSSDKIRPTGYYLAIALEAGGIFSALCFGWSYRNFLHGGLLLPAVAAAGIYSVFAIFGMLLAPSRTRRLWVIAVQCLAIVAFFYDVPWQFLAAVGTVLYLFFLWGEFESQAEVNNSLEIKFFRVTRPVINKIITAFALVAVLLYLPQWSAENAFMSETSFEEVYGWTAGFAQSFYPDVSLNSTWNDFAESLVRLQLSQNQTYQQLLPPARARAVEEAKAQMLQGFAKNFSFEIAENDRTSTVAYRYLLQMLEKFRDDFDSRFLTIWAIGAFLVIRGFGFIFHIIVGFVSFLLYQLLLALSVLKITGESRSKETLDYA